MNNNDELKEIEDKIKNGAFIVEKFQFPQKKDETVPVVMRVCTKMRVFGKYDKETFFVFA